MTFSRSLFLKAFFKFDGWEFDVILLMVQYFLIVCSLGKEFMLKGFWVVYDTDISGFGWVPGCCFGESKVIDPYLCLVTIIQKYCP